jgi:hypothetical protein
MYMDKERVGEKQEILTGGRVSFGTTGNVGNIHLCKEALIPFAVYVPMLKQFLCTSAKCAKGENLLDEPM